MLFPLGWTLNPLLVPSFVPTTSNMQKRQSSNSSNSLPEYNVLDRDAPPSYPLDDFSRPPAPPEKALTHLPRDETRVEASTPPLVDNHLHVQNGMNFDVEANMATATVCSSSPHMT